MQDVLYMIVPCFNEENVLPLTAGTFLQEMEALVRKEKISPESRILFVNDGSTDRTWDVIRALALEDERYMGLSLTENCGKPLALKAGMKEALSLGADMIISPDCDGQDDVKAMEAMVDAADEGSQIVYGVPSVQGRENPLTGAVRRLACRWLGRKYPGLDPARSSYRLVTRSVLEALCASADISLYLEGLCPGAGFELSEVPYERKQRAGGRSRKGGSRKKGSILEGTGRGPGFPFLWMAAFGLLLCLLSLPGAVYGLIQGSLAGAFWSFMSGLQTAGIGAAGAYVEKLLRERGNRSGYVISCRTWERRRKAETPPAEQ